LRWKVDDDGNGPLQHRDVFGDALLEIGGAVGWIARHPGELAPDRAKNRFRLPTGVQPFSDGLGATSPAVEFKLFLLAADGCELVS